MPINAATIEGLRHAALRYPEAVEEAPWGHRVLKVKGKLFAFIEDRDGVLHMGLKLPRSSVMALENAWATPMGYGMGKHGWVSMDIAPDAVIDVDELLAWVDESYRAVAPRKLVAILDSGERPPPPPIVHRAEGRVLMLVGSDHLRRGRAREGLEARGAEVAGANLQEALGLVGEVVPHGLMVDLSRDATEALALLPELVLAADDAVIAVAGVRDAKQERAVRALGSFGLVSRDAPGEHAVMEAFAALLG